MAPKAKSSEYVTYEWSCAYSAEVKVIPLILEAKQLHPRLEALQYIDCTESHPWEELITRLKQIRKEQGVRIAASRDVPQPIRRAYINLNSWDHKKRQSGVRE